MKTLKKINEAFDEAKRSKDTLSLNVIRSIKALLTNGEKEKKEVDEEFVIQCLKKQYKQRQDSLIQYEKFNREDLAEVEREECKIIEGFLPEQMNEEEIDELVRACIFEKNTTSMRDMGGVMSLAKEKAKGKADNAILSKKIKEKLS